MELNPKSSVTPTAWEVAKAEQVEALERVSSLIQDLGRFDCWAGCFEQLAEAVEELKSSTAKLEATELE